MQAAVQDLAEPEHGAVAGAVGRTIGGEQGGVGLGGGAIGDEIGQRKRGHGGILPAGLTWEEFIAKI